ncbi:ribosomal protein S9, ribosomal protein S5 domain 2-type fold protein, partial [Tanacetum coccineum]
LPPLSTIEDMHYEKNTRKSIRADIERQKQEEIANARVRQGKFLINGNQFDVYFPMLDQRAALLRSLTETKTLGLLDVNCTVKGGQIGAIRLGMSRELQNWAPDQFRPPLKEGPLSSLSFHIFEGGFSRVGKWAGKIVATTIIKCAAKAFGDKLKPELTHISWFLDKRLEKCGAEETWQGESKKELPTGQALDGF